MYLIYKISQERRRLCISLATSYNILHNYLLLSYDIISDFLCLNDNLRDHSNCVFFVRHPLENNFLHLDGSLFGLNYQIAL